MPATQLRRYPAILTSLIARAVTRTGLTDITSTSRFKRLLAGVARELDEINYQLVRITDVWDLNHATGEDLDRRVADLQPLGLVRLTARRATGQLVFSRRVASGTTRIIPAGTVGLTPSGIAVRSTREAEILSTSAEQISGHGVGRDSAPVPGVVVTPGATELATGAVTRLQGSITGVDEVTNVAAFTGGRDQESDDALRARAKAYLVSLARCGYRAIEYAAIGISDGTREVTFARAIPNPDRRGDVYLYIDDGTGAAETYEAVTDEIVTAGLLGPPADTAVGGEEYLSLDQPPVRYESAYEIRVNGTALVNDVELFLSPTDGVLKFVPALSTGDDVRADYVRYTGLIAAVQQVISGVQGDPVNYPGWGAAGVRTRVRAPTIVSPSFAGNLFLAEGTTRADAIVAAQSATTKLINSGGISDDAVLAQVVREVMRIPGIKDFVLTTPTENVVALDHELIRITDADVDYD